MNRHESANRGRMMVIKPADYATLISWRIGAGCTAMPRFRRFPENDVAVMPPAFCQDDF